jgi:hypothetical protein
MNSVWAAFGPRTQPIGSAQLDGTQSGRLTAWHGTVQAGGGQRAQPGWGGTVGGESSRELWALRLIRRLGRWLTLAVGQHGGGDIRLGGGSRRWLAV